MWLNKSSIGRKFLMSISGLFLFIFLALHGSLNLMAVYDALHVENGQLTTHLFNQIAEFMSTNLLVQIMVPVLALGFIVHIIYATILTLQNRKARGNDRYGVSSKTPIPWNSRNMFVLGVIVLGVLALHLYNFFADMQLKEWMGQEAALGFNKIVEVFANPVYTCIYLIWLVALWFHLTHGFWSAFQTIGWNNAIWYKRLKVIGIVLATILVLNFVIVAVYFGFIYNGPVY
ncbi:succinate dehydrogenase [Porphyromonas macacae]|uniref:Succinate dehydrogenase n=1 Tax=Porphyromonas macacae TaxID=28115 RepID=A0A0A2E4N1_9PORP|nr:succinate dehydrogenase cytochrome b subunit [Porphyromonas macacae]KGN72385.1 succinate dehydrogenase [Porphyromonas macacae]SUB88509.1 succinate dehydrogenase (or fumarate reductase) cytochrome b subunit, b558 family [Porphyromonas macacae]